MKSLSFSTIIFFLSSIAFSKILQYDESKLKQWYYGDAVRGRDYPAKLFPQVTTKDKVGQSIFVCTGAGCPLRFRMHLNAAHLKSVKSNMEKACPGLLEKCEIEALREGVRTLETIVWKELLFKLKGTDLDKAWDKNSIKSSLLTSHPGYDQHLTLDCVDQANNGTTYLVVLSNWGLLKSTKIIEPGLEHLGFQPHYFSRIKNKNGQIFKFDLYNRSNSTANRRLPILIKESRDRSSL